MRIDSLNVAGDGLLQLGFLVGLVYVTANYRSVQNVAGLRRAWVALGASIAFQILGITLVVTLGGRAVGDAFVLWINGAIPKLCLLFGFAMFWQAIHPSGQGDEAAIGNPSEGGVEIS